MTRGKVLREAVLTNDALHILWDKRLLIRPDVYCGHFRRWSNSERVKVFDWLGALRTLLLLNNMLNFIHSVRDEP